ncbi:carbohydrate-binding module family 50 protein [Fusarium flagelliforme]|uniref:Carbohydrate-binding module family 50 protein n=1 Tax=Fusarium flagelliforme TaxID=2675880 RepID=A0A395MYK1_9HYPO|nr:carbohydrate-binding module family 50 protein [Fusarium flagelliforme]
MAKLSAFSILVNLVSPSIGWYFITKDSLPSDDLSRKCIDALVAEISCPQQISTFPSTDYISSSSLEERECSEKDVVAWNPNSAEPEHISVLGETLFYHFNRTCIKDGPRWCNVWAHENSGDTPRQATSTGTSVAVDECDNCAIKKMQFQAGSPDGYDLQPHYKSLTEKCRKTGFPLATTVSDNRPSSIPTDEPKQSCDGEEYVVKKSDTCQSVSKSQNVATSLLLRDNNLQAFCANFPKEGETLCIKNKCKVHVVDKDNTCPSIASAARISQVQLYTWNPILGVSCRNIAKSVGDTICLEPPGDDDYTPPRTSPAATTTSTILPSAAPVPSDISNGTTEVCAQYYQVETGDYCNKIILKYTISLDDFLFLNQGINKNCTNLFAKESYCVEPVGPIEKYPDHPDYVPPFTFVSEIRFDDLPEATFKIPRKTDSPKKLPLAKGTRKECYIYVDGSDLHTEDTWALDESECKALAGTWRITLEELQSWNPSLDTSLETCEMDVKYRYCMKAHKSNGHSPASTDENTAPSGTEQPTKTDTTGPVASSTELPIRDGAIEGCKEYKPFRAPDTCQDMLDDNSITIKQFFKWNPSVGSECGNLWPGYRYCVKA